MIPRSDHIDRVSALIQRFPVVAIIGARQVGKTTLARQIAAQSDVPVTRFDLEDPADLARLQVPTLTLESIGGLVVLDEIQRVPVTKSMRVARDDLELDELVVVHAGEHSYPMEEGIRAVSARRMSTDLSLG